MSTQHAHALSGCGPEAPNPDSSPLSTCDIHSILSNQRRLYLLEELFARKGRAEFDDLVDAVCERELEATGEKTSWSDKRKSVRVSLYQTHMSRLKDDAIVDYARRTGTIALAQNSDIVAPYLDVEVETAGFLDRVSSALRSMY